MSKTDKHDKEDKDDIIVIIDEEDEDDKKEESSSSSSSSSTNKRKKDQTLAERLKDKNKQDDRKEEEKHRKWRELRRREGATEEEIDSEEKKDQEYMNEKRARNQEWLNGRVLVLLDWKTDEVRDYDILGRSYTPVWLTTKQWEYLTTHADEDDCIDLNDVWIHTSSSYLSGDFCNFSDICRRAFTTIEDIVQAEWRYLFDLDEVSAWERDYLPEFLEILFVQAEKDGDYQDDSPVWAKKKEAIRMFIPENPRYVRNTPEDDHDAVISFSCACAIWQTIEENAFDNMKEEVRKNKRDLKERLFEKHTILAEEESFKNKVFIDFFFPESIPTEQDWAIISKKEHIWLWENKAQLTVALKRQTKNNPHKLRKTRKPLNDIVIWKSSLSNPFDIWRMTKTRHIDTNNKEGFCPPFLRDVLEQMNLHQH